MRERTYRHRASGAVAVMKEREHMGTAGTWSTLECISDLRGAIDREAFPFTVTLTREMQPCCEMQGSVSGYYGGLCPVHGAPFYLELHYAEPKRMSQAELDAEWEVET